MLTAPYLLPESLANSQLLLAPLLLLESLLLLPSLLLLSLQMMIVSLLLLCRDRLGRDSKTLCGPCSAGDRCRGSCYPMGQRMVLWILLPSGPEDGALDPVTQWAGGWCLGSSYPMGQRIDAVDPATLQASR